MFRFAQRLATILEGRDLTSTERSGLDGYDIELEDALSAATPSGDSLWEETGGDLHPISDPHDVTIQTTSTATSEQLSLSSGADIGFATVRDINETIGRDNNITVTRDWNLQATGEAVVAGGTAARLLGDLVEIEADTTDVGITSTAGDVNITAGDGLTVNATGTIFFDTADTFLAGSTGVMTLGTNSSDITLDPSTTGNLIVILGTNFIVTGLPTSDPGVSGALYSVAGILHISP